MAKAAKRSFPLAIVLSVVHDRRFTKRGMGGIYELLRHILDGEVPVWAMASAMPRARDSILREHRTLAEAAFPDISGQPIKDKDRQTNDWLKAQKRTFGETLIISTAEDTSALPPAPQLAGIKEYVLDL